MVTRRTLCLPAVLLAAGCSEVSRPPLQNGGATLVITRHSLAPAFATADSVHVRVTRGDGSGVAETGVRFTADSVAISFPLVLLDETERFLLTLSLLMGGGVIASETVPFTVERGRGAQAVLFTLRVWAPGTAGLTVPSPREGAAIAYVPGVGGAVLTGGLDAGGDSLNDAWLFNGASWEPMAPMPDFRRDHVIVPIGGDSALVFGGLPPTLPLAIRRRTLLFDGSAWVPASGPVTRYGAAGAFDAGRGQAVLFGGTSTDPDQRRATTFLYRNAWQELEVAGPSARFGHTMVYHARQDAIVLLGGMNQSGAELGDVWIWRGEEEGWMELQTVGVLPPRSGHTSFYDPGRASVVVVGGRRGGEVLDDVWELHGDTWTERSPDPRPPGNGRGVSAFLDARDLGVLLAGRDASGLLNTFWLYR